MLCRTCETVIPDSEVKCPKCGNNPKLLNENYVDIENIEKLRPYIQTFGILIQLCQLTFFYALYNAIPLPNWFIVLLICLEIIYIGIYRFAFIKPLEMRWVFMSIYLPILPPFLYRKIKEKTEAIIFLTIGGILLLGIIFNIILG